MLTKCIDTCIRRLQRLTFYPSGPLQESAIWIDESQTVNVRRLHTQLPMFSKDDDDPLGISDEGIQYVHVMYL